MLRSAGDGCAFTSCYNVSLDSVCHMLCGSTLCYLLCRSSFHVVSGRRQHADLVSSARYSADRQMAPWKPGTRGHDRGHSWRWSSLQHEHQTQQLSTKQRKNIYFCKLQLQPHNRLIIIIKNIMHFHITWTVYVDWCVYYYRWTGLITTLAIALPLWSGVKTLMFCLSTNTLYTHHEDVYTHSCSVAVLFTHQSLMLCSHDLFSVAIHGHYLLIIMTCKPANTEQLWNICTMLDQRRRRWAAIVQMFYKCFLFARFMYIHSYSVAIHMYYLLTMMTCTYTHVL